MAAATLPLAGLRVLDLTEGAAQSCGRYLADLGAQVILAEPPGGSPGRQEPVPFALRNANKASVILDLGDPAGRADLLRLAGASDLLLESSGGSFDGSSGALTAQTVRRAHPGLVVVSITSFGRTGPYRDFAATEPVLAALGGVLSRSGRPGAAPLLPPAGLIEPTVGVHAAWAALVAYVHRLRTGIGEHVDVSALEAVIHGFDPGFGTQGSAAAGRPESFPRGRPDASNLYPVFGCADGHVRICVLARRQWRAMFSWLGEPAEFADPRYDAIPARYEAAARLNPLIAALFAGATRADLVAEGTRRGIPVAGVLTPAEVLAAGHFTASGTLVDAEIADGLTARIPSGYVSVDGVRAGLRQRAPRPGEHDVSRTAPPGSAAAPAGLAAEQTGSAADRHWPVPAAASGQPPDGQPPDGWSPDGWSPGDGPLAGLRVLDLGVIVFGAELGRLFADQGADVIKIENSAFPDGLRQTRKGGGMNASFAWGHRNKRGLGLDLRTDEGRRLFGQLTRQADVVAANFKPGTLASLGLSHAELSVVNPGIVVCESSAFGSRGPWRERLGYGPLVRASCGVTALWRDPELAPDDPGAFCDGSTVYPDHIAGHVAAVAVLAALIGRSRSSRGAAIEIAQADVALMHLGPALAAESLALPPTAHVPAGVFSCAGDDEWCVIDVRNDADWARLARALGRPELAAGDLATSGGRLRRRAEVEDLVACWTATRPPAQVMSVLQAAGVPAGAMLRLPDELTDPHLTARESFRTLAHPLLSRPVPANARIARFSSIPDPPLRPAPMPGEHTRDIGRTLLGLTDDDIGRLVRAGVLQLPQEAVALPAIPGAITPQTAGKARMPGLAAQPSDLDRRNSARRAPAGQDEAAPAVW